MPSKASSNSDNSNPGASKHRGSLSEVFVESLRRFRTERDIQVVDLADLVGITRRTMHRWLSNESLPNDGTMRRVCRRLNLDFEAFTRGEFQRSKEGNVEFLVHKLSVMLSSGDADAVYRLVSALALETYHYMRMHLFHVQDSVDFNLSTRDIQELRVTYRPYNSITSSEVRIYYILGPRPDSKEINLQIAVSRSQKEESFDNQQIVAMVPLNDAVLENTHDVIQMCCKRLDLVS